jgi:dGTPase
VQQIKSWLFKHLYRHSQVIAKMDEAQGMVRELFASYLAHPQLLPAAYSCRDDLARATADYIAGMTDRFAELKWRESKALK